MESKFCLELEAAGSEAAVAVTPAADGFPVVTINDLVVPPCWPPCWVCGKAETVVTELGVGLSSSALRATETSEDDIVTGIVGKPWTASTLTCMPFLSASRIVPGGGRALMVGGCVLTTVVVVCCCCCFSATAAAATTSILRGWVGNKLAGGPEGVGATEGGCDCCWGATGGAFTVVMLEA